MPAITDATIAIASGKGGTGKTFVSTNLFWVAQQENKPVAIIDCDAEEPNVIEFIKGELIETKNISQLVPEINTNACTFCGKCYEYCNYNAILFLPDSNFIKVIEELCHNCGACSFACKYEAISEHAKIIGKISSYNYHNKSHVIEGRSEIGIHSPVAVIKKSIKEVNEGEIALLDSPPGISCPFIATVEKADYVVLVTEPTPFGLNDLKLTVDTLVKINKKFGVIVNRSNIGNRDVYKYLEDNKIELLMEIPMDREIAKIYSEGRILVSENPVYKKLFIQLLNKIETVLK